MSRNLNPQRAIDLLFYNQARAATRGTLIGAVCSREASQDSSVSDVLAKVAGRAILSDRNYFELLIALKVQGKIPDPATVGRKFFEKLDSLSTQLAAG